MGTKRRPRSLNEDEPEQELSLPLQPPLQHCIALHRSRHWAWSPSTVVAISACPAAPLAAIGYESGDLELWDLVHITCIQRIVGEGVEITALTWACDSLDGSWRTFCAALDGSLAEVQWKAGKLEASTDSGAGAIWSLAAQPAAAVSPGFAHSLAASCDDGSVRIFHVEGGETGAHYSRTLARLQGRALAVAWHPSGSVLVAGGADGCIHVLDPSNGSEHLRITAGAATTRPVCVWRLAVLPNGTIVSGDSDGAVQFWDGRFGSLLHRFTQHRADILAVVPAPDGESIFASGVDPAVVLFRHTQGDVPNTVSSKSAGEQGSTKASGVSGGGQWVYTHHKRPHSHDVRAMDVVRLGGGRAVLLSGGVDTQLIAYPVASFLEEHPARLSKCPQRPMCHLALGALAGSSSMQQQQHQHHHHQQQLQQLQEQPPLLLCAQHDVLDVWQVARTVANRGTSKQQQQQQQQLNGGDGLGGIQGEGEDGHTGPMHIAGETLDLTSAPRHLARIRCGAGRISACAISPDGRFVACVGGSQGRVRLYQLPAQQQHSSVANGNNLGGDGVVARVKLPALEPCSTLAFTPTLLLLAHTTGALSALALPSNPSPASSEVAASTAATPAAHLVSRLGPREGQQQQQQLLQGGVLAAGEGERAGLSQASVWRAFAAPVSHLAVSPDGGLVAVAGSGGISLVRLQPSTQKADGAKAGATDDSRGSDSENEEEGSRGGSHSKASPTISMSYSGKLLRAGHDAPLTSLAFSADGEVLAATLASGHLAVYECASGRPTFWSLEYSTEIAACLERLPGTPVGCSFSPDPTCRQLMVYSPGGFCTLDTQKAPDCAAAQRSRLGNQKRRRGPVAPHLHSRPNELSSLGGADVAGGPCLDAAPGLRGKAASHGGGNSSNGRTILLRDPCAFLGHLSPSEAILLEKPWEDVASTFAPPLYAHRYGS